jgi:hypothetical protein
VSQPIDREGNFRGTIVSYGIRKEKTGAVGVNLIALIEEAWNEEEKRWEDWRQYEYAVEGVKYIVTKSKQSGAAQVNENAVKSLIECAGWSGDLFNIYAQQWQPKPCAFTVEEDEYNGVVRYRIGFLNPYDSSPGLGANVDEDRVRALDAQWGSQLRALAGNSSRNASPPAGKPTSPSRRSAAPARPTKALPRKADHAQEDQGSEAPGDGVPF